MTTILKKGEKDNSRIARRLVSELVIGSALAIVLVCYLLDLSSQGRVGPTNALVVFTWLNAPFLLLLNFFVSKGSDTSPFVFLCLPALVLYYTILFVLFCELCVCILVCLSCGCSDSLNDVENSETAPCACPEVLDGLENPGIEAPNGKN